MQKDILVTTTSFQDTPGIHIKTLKKQNYSISTLRGPLTEDEIFSVIDKYDAIICGDDEITRKVIENGASGKLKVISKYGTGLDKIDLKAANDFNIEVRNCPNINQKSVAEHVFSLLLSYSRNIITVHNHIQNNEWVRITGSDINEKVIGIVGTGAIGKEVIKKAAAFDLNILAYDLVEDDGLKREFNVKYCKNLNELFYQSDYITLHIPLNDNTYKIINESSVKSIKPGAILINTSRGGLVSETCILEALDKGILAGYLCDVLEEEPMVSNHSFLGHDKIIITPHIGSRTKENVQKQGLMAVNNLIEAMERHV